MVWFDSVLDYFGFLRTYIKDGNIVLSHVLARAEQGAVLLCLPKNRNMSLSETAGMYLSKRGTMELASTRTAVTYRDFNSFQTGTQT